MDRTDNTMDTEVTHAQIPEFILPNQPESNAKPAPPAGLSEYLCNQTSDHLHTYQQVTIDHLYQLISDLKNGKTTLDDTSSSLVNFVSIVWLDLEIHPKTKQLINGAFLWGNTYCFFDKKTFYAQLNTIINILHKIDAIGGHNIIAFDIPQLMALLATHLSPKNITLLQQSLVNKACDTLILSSLFIPHQSSHALAKLYKANTATNDPIQDCMESRYVFELCVKAWALLPITFQIVFSKLIPPLGQIKNSVNLPYFNFDSDTIFDLHSIVTELPEGNHESLLAHIRKGFAGNGSTNAWSQLGLAVFLNWLRYFQKPQARRPVWINNHEMHSAVFKKAEQVFWHLDAVSESWINQQCYAFFGFEQLREGQMSIVKAVLENKDIPLGILPTGGGKSLTFQLPALVLSKFQRQLTVVICPLKALIEDQVVNMHTNLPDYESRVAYLTSGQTPETQQSITKGVWHGDIDILYLSPERLRTHTIRTLLKHRPPAFWVLDEAHTLSQWGTDFRPDFLRIADHIVACYGKEFSKPVETDKTQENKQADLFADTINHHDEVTENVNLNTSSDSINSSVDATEAVAVNHPTKQKSITIPKISLVTATASARVKDDLQSELVNKLVLLTQDKPLVQYGTDIKQLKIWRDEISAYFEETAKDSRKSRIYQLLQQRKKWYETNHPDHPEKGVAIVYLRNRNGCNEYAEDFAKQGLNAVAYHSKLDESQKKAILQKFKNHELQVVVCTNAFGMGIDKEGIHTVIHSGPPANLESYIQEIGRVARKSHEVGEAYMLWSDEDIQFLFLQERQSRIPNTNTLKDCWSAIKPTLKKPLEEQWFPSSSLMPILQVEDTEQLNTQIRVALLALERYGLLIEKDQQPAWISIKLLDNVPANALGKLAKLYAQLQQISDGSITLKNSIQSHQVNPFSPPSHDDNSNKELTKYHLPEIAMVLGYSVKSLLKNLRELVKAGYAQWEVTISVRLKYRHKTLRARINKLSPQLQAMQDFINSQQDALGNNSAEIATQGAIRMHTQHIDNWLTQHKFSIKFKKQILPMMRALAVIKTRQHSKTQVFVSSSASTKLWLTENDLEDTWQNWLKLAREKVLSLRTLFELLLNKFADEKDAKAQEFNLEALATPLNTEPTLVIEQLEYLQRLEMIELSRFDDNSDAIFFIGENRKDRKNYNAVAYDYLHQHYEDRCMRIHVLHQWLQMDTQKQRQMIEDYFAKPLNSVINQYINPEVNTKRPYIKNYQKEILPSYFSDVQTQIVKETSRACMVLAGPGSGKTTVVVHRVAYLLMIAEIKPEKILILAYNRLAVLELRERLTRLVGHHALGVTIQTFHGLARQITEMSEADATQIEVDDVISRYPRIQANKDKQQQKTNARYQWIIEQAIRDLQEQPQHFQYIMVDEFQDIDREQYKLIGLLADLQPQEAETQTDPELEKTEQDKTDTSKPSNYEQRGYLMVVGDDDQNLYAFRGASIEFIQQFSLEYHLDAEKTYYLLDNFRSANNIVNLANRFIETALPNNERLKDATHQIKHTSPYMDIPIRYGFYQQKQGVDMASWLVADIQQKAQKNNRKPLPC